MARELVNPPPRPNPNPQVSPVMRSRSVEHGDYRGRPFRVVRRGARRAYLIIAFLPLAVLILVMATQSHIVGLMYLGSHLLGVALYSSLLQYDLRASTAQRVGWVLGFVFAGPVSFPLYWFIAVNRRHVPKSAPPSVIGRRAAPSIGPNGHEPRDARHRDGHHPYPRHQARSGYR